VEGQKVEKGSNGRESKDFGKPAASQEQIK